MGTRELIEAFNEVAVPDATCMKALLEYQQFGGTEWQVLYFSGNYADGSGFSIKSDRIRPNADVNNAARDTAARLLEQQRAT